MSEDIHKGFSTQGLSSLPSHQQCTILTDVHSVCSQQLQLPLSRQQERLSHHHVQLNLNVHQFCQSDPLYGSCISSVDVVGAETADKASSQQQILPITTRCRTACRNKNRPLMTSGNQQGCPLMHKREHRRQQQSSWKTIPDFAIRLCINVLGSCL